MRRSLMRSNYSAAGQRLQWVECGRQCPLAKRTQIFANRLVDRAALENGYRLTPAVWSRIALNSDPASQSGQSLGSEAMALPIT